MLPVTTVLIFASMAFVVLALILSFHTLASSDSYRGLLDISFPNYKLASQNSYSKPTSKITLGVKQREDVLGPSYLQKAKEDVLGPSYLQKEKEDVLGPSYLQKAKEDVLGPSYLPTAPLAETNYEDSDGYLLMHTWFEGKKLFTGFELFVKGFIVTQNLKKMRLVIWMTELWADSDDPYKTYIVHKYSHHPKIQFRMFNKLELVPGTCWAERKEFLDKSTILSYGIRDYSNVVRWLILNKYGGIWLDADSIPLLDMTVLHERYPDSLVAGYAPPRKDEIEKDPSKVKELGMFNNNFLMVTHKPMRKKIMEVACEFRRKPVENPKKGQDPFVNVIPHVGEDNHEMYVMNHWLFNDGALRWCWHRDDCNITTIDLGSTDPIWVRTNDMYAICERVIQSMDAYTAHFSDLIKANAADTFRDYIDSHDFDKFVWVVHNRLAHCRTAGTTPLGMSKMFGSLISNRLGDGSNVYDAPEEAVDVLAYDKMEERVPNFQVEYTPLIIVVESYPEDFADRQFVRSMVHMKSWFPVLFDSMSRHFKLFFVTWYHPTYKDWNAKLHAELYEFEDLILVDPQLDRVPIFDNSYVTSTMYRGVLKILNRYDSRFMLFLYRSLYSQIFVHMRNLFYLLNVATGQSLFNKERPVKSFIATHPLDDTLEKQIGERLNKLKDGTFQTVFRPPPRNRDPRAKPHTFQQFLLFSRDYLGEVLGISSANSTAASNQPNFDFLFTRAPTTMDAVVSRLPPTTGVPSAAEADLPVKGLRALSVESFRFVGAPWGSSSMAGFLGDYKPKTTMCKSQVRKTYGPAAPTAEGPYAYLTPSQYVKGNAVYDLHMNTTFVWGVPCTSAVWQLTAAFEDIPFSFVK